MPRLRVLTTCPGTDWLPGQVVDATPEQAQEFARSTEVVRDRLMERATEAPRGSHFAV